MAQALRSQMPNARGRPRSPRTRAHGAHGGRVSRELIDAARNSTQRLLGAQARQVSFLFIFLYVTRGTAGRMQIGLVDFVRDFQWISNVGTLAHGGMPGNPNSNLD